MNAQDKINQQIKEAALEKETQSFSTHDKIWNRVEKELDKKQKKRFLYWKPLSIAASVALIASIGVFFWNTNTDAETNPIIVKETTTPKEKDATIVETEEIVKKDSSLRFESNKQKVEEQIAIAPPPPPIPSVIPKIIESYEPEILPKHDEIQELKEVIITGYKTIAKPETTGSVQTIYSESLEQNSNINNTQTLPVAKTTLPLSSKKVSDAQTLFGIKGNVIIDENVEPLAKVDVSRILQGDTPGVQITPSTGRPGQAATIKIRGSGSMEGGNDPLYVVDGIPVSSSEFGSINPKDIENVNVLKDANATAIYGNKGSNGVVVITTTNELSNKEKRKLRKEYRNKLKTKRQLNSSKKKENRMTQQEKKQIIEYKNSIDSDNDNIPDYLDSCPDDAGKSNTNSNKHGCPETSFIDIDQEDYESFVENQFESPQNVPLSTFSVDVDRASYSNIRRFLNNGQTVPKDAVRIEEMINYFDYEYNAPKGKHPIAFTTEYSNAPWNPNHKLLKIGLKGKDIPTHKLPASNLVFLIDVSGSMDSQNKLPLLKSSFKLLVNQLRKEDKISIVVYAGAAGLVLEPTSGEKKNKIIRALNNLNAGGSTAGGAGIELAYKIAEEQFIKGGNNRVILATDGDFNVGASSNQDMESLIEEKRKSGVFLTCLGYGMGNYKDSKMEILADKGNGNYAYIDNMQEANKTLVEEFAGTVFTIAKDVKMQVEFNPANVKAYRLIGYENRKLRPEDFTNDAIDAGDMGAEHTVTALYEIIPTGVESDFFGTIPDLKYSKLETKEPQYGNELATLKFRYKDPDANKSKELVETVANHSMPIAQTSNDFKFASAVAWFGLKLRDSKLIPNKETESIVTLAKQGIAKDEDGYRKEFIRLVKTVR